VEGCLRVTTPVGRFSGKEPKTSIRNPSSHTKDYTM
jgi:hypothetical protein